MMPQPPRQLASLASALALAAVLPCVAAGVHAEGLGWDGRQDVDQTGVELLVSPFTYHFHHKPEHRPVWLLGGSKIQADGQLVGASLFSNSFGQLCAYGFVGHKYVEPFGWKRTYWAWTAGAIYGYRGEYKHQAGANILGFTPVIVPRLGYRIGPKVALELQPLGLAAMMFSVAVDLP